MIESLIARLPRPPRLFRPARPTVAVEILEEHVALVRAGKGVPRDETAYYIAPLEPGTVRSSPTLQNVTGPDAVRRILAAGRDHLAPGGGPVALCVPDVLARVALLTADTFPRKHDELREMVTWKIKKSLPYRVDEAALDWQVFPSPDGKEVLLAVVVRRQVLAEYEDLLAAEGLPVGSVIPSTFALAERLPATQEGDAGFVSLASGWFSMLVVGARGPLFYRCKPLPEAERRGMERDWFVAGELVPSLEYYRSRLKGAGLRTLHLHVADDHGMDGLNEALAGTLTDQDMLPGLPLPALPTEGLPEDLRARLAAAACLAHRGSWREETAARPAAEELAS